MDAMPVLIVAQYADGVHSIYWMKVRDITVYAEWR